MADSSGDSDGRKAVKWIATVVVVPTLLGLALLGERPLWVKWFDKGFVTKGDCPPYRVYSQNRWPPLGTAIRVEPAAESAQIGKFAGNDSIMVDGWLHGAVAHPTNPEPWNSDVWFHLTDSKGWVSFAGVRGVPTEPDLTLHSDDGGQPAPLLAPCEGEMR
ncbi:hypothetical protein [Micromonospora echinospora]|uniref:hypothetical protein n=1 Tax=Micromonospora echinospora TaxID=1877 RepID=UPI003A83B76F